MAEPGTTIRANTRLSFFKTKRGRDHLTAFVFLAPAALIILVFEFFPVIFAFLVSLYDWRRFPDEFVGLDSYVDALGSFAYVIFFWIAMGILAASIVLARRFWRHAQPARLRVRALPGALLGLTFLTFVNWVFVVLPIIMDATRRVRGQQATTNTFIGEFFNSFTFPEAVAAANVFLLVGVIAISVMAVFAYRLGVSNAVGGIMQAAIVTIVLGIGLVLLRLTLGEVHITINEALADGEPLPVWTHVLLIGAGAGMLGLAYWVWSHVGRAETNGGLWLRLVARACSWWAAWF
ncbi:MAG: sugar ABC transporter permease [Blastochloris sp.]|nr:sugar ABC transporter permease [Blastochloris sp.]